MTRGKRHASPPETLEVALSLARHGWHVFPVTIYLDDDPALDKRHKVPAVPRGTSWKDWATTDVEAVATAWAGEYSGCWIGVYAEASGIVVLDLDRRPNDGAKSLKAAGVTVPPTFHYKTLGGGTHHVYAAPASRALTNAQGLEYKGAKLPGVDVRAGNGLMVYYGPELTKSPTLAPAPEWALVDASAKGADREPGANVADWLKRTTSGEPTKPVRKALETVTNSLSHDDMLGAVKALIKLGSERGAGEAYEQARAVYIKGRPDRAREWDAAAEGSVKRLGLPPVTLELPPPAVRHVDKATRLEALKAVRAAFRRWLGDEYDLDVLLIVLAAAAVEQIDGDPLWLLIVGGPGGAKTETGMALQGADARVVSSIASVGSLLSATSKREHTKAATGGLLREVGDRGLIFIKDFTTIISQNANTRAEVLAALREIYDGYWTREVGTDGGRSLNWEGRLSLIGAVTTAWDTAHGVVASMGDRFTLVRIDSQHGRTSAGRQAIANVGSEKEMRAELAEAAGAILSAVDDTRPPSLKHHDKEAILAAADVVTRARTAVEKDYQGKVIDAHAPESPTRFAKQLGQVMRGAMAIGVKRDKALELTIRCARDSMPPLRLMVLEDVAVHPYSSTTHAARRLQKPRSTIDRTLQELHLLDLLVVDDDTLNENGSKPWLYSVAPGVDLSALTTASQDPFITRH